ncbi:MAG: hypothetical protein IPK02_14180 [Candidatus Accumulibacter sp.]|uniref:Uncharacterized protein n=1 Tax=Candidatus Accumulibacter affinis TaxID=2954384 RepID=A0A935W442_9PROT|nr:hypothetical protein [Candidatus Accumulibacter affinis]
MNEALGRLVEIPLQWQARRERSSRTPSSRGLTQIPVRVSTFAFGDEIEVPECRHLIDLETPDLQPGAGREPKRPRGAYRTSLGNIPRLEVASNRG